MKDKSKQAFPLNDGPECGMTLLEYFVAHAPAEPPEWFEPMLAANNPTTKKQRYLQWPLAWAKEQIKQLDANIGIESPSGGIKIYVVGDGESAEVYSNLGPNYFNVSVDINPNVSIENRTVRHKEEDNRID